MVLGAAALDELGQRRYVAGAGRPRRISPIGRVLPNDLLDDSVVVEHRHAVGSDPDVALQPGCAEFEGQLEAGQSVLRGMGPGPAVAEGDGVVEERWEALLHP